MLHGLEIAPDAVDVAENLLGILKDHLTRFGELDPGLDPAKELMSKGDFELLDLNADRGLGDSEFFGRLRDAAPSGNYVEVVEMVEIEWQQDSHALLSETAPGVGVYNQVVDGDIIIYRIYIFQIYFLYFTYINSLTMLYVKGAGVAGKTCGNRFRKSPRRGGTCRDGAAPASFKIKLTT